MQRRAHGARRSLVSFPSPRPEPPSAAAARRLPPDDSSRRTCVRVLSLARPQEEMAQINHMKPELLHRVLLGCMQATHEFFTTAGVAMQGMEAVGPSSSHCVLCFSAVARPPCEPAQAGPPVVASQIVKGAGGDVRAVTQQRSTYSQPQGAPHLAWEPRCFGSTGNVCFWRALVAHR